MLKYLNAIRKIMCWMKADKLNLKKSKANGFQKIKVKRYSLLFENTLS